MVLLQVKDPLELHEEKGISSRIGFLSFCGMTKIVERDTKNNSL